MRSFLLLAGLIAISTARPEVYREKEDFKYSRSSTDEGSKSGYYGAQRGNMGGNYERAHNMDVLAQSQMSGIMRQVHGELGEGVNTPKGKVFGSASTSGIYGHGNYDLRNLEGRNFQEGVNHDESRSSSLRQNSESNRNSASSSSYHSGYNGHSSSAKNSQYTDQGVTGHSQHSIEDVDANSENYYNKNTNKHSGYSTGYHSESGYSGQSEYNRNLEQNSDNNYKNNNYRRMNNYAPMRVVVRPGAKASTPFTAQVVDDGTNSFDENSINNGESRLKSNNKAQHYESSFDYRKEWEKHDTKPVVIPLSRPTQQYVTLEDDDRYQNHFSSNSRLTDNSNRQYSEDAERLSKDYRSNMQTRSRSQTQNDLSYENQRKSSSVASNVNERSNSYKNSESSFGDQVRGTFDSTSSTPKRYESSYAYHKSWERQGDPYVIKPASHASSNDQISERLTDASSNHGSAYSSHQYGNQQYRHSQSYHNNQDKDDCVDEHVRVRRSQNSENKSKITSQENIEQESQATWGNLEDLGQQSQTQWLNIEDQGQQTQNMWQERGDVGQQTQNNWSDLDQHSQGGWGQVEDLGQQTQNNWGKFDDLGQQTQNRGVKLEDLEKTQDTSSKLEDLGQQEQTNWGQENLQQQSQHDWSTSDTLGQQSENHWDYINQQSPNNMVISHK